jgi:hypothetical protein
MQFGPSFAGAYKLCPTAVLLRFGVNTEGHGLATAGNYRSLPA